MELVPGQLVRSLAGRDKGNYYLVVGFRDGLFLVADGKQRKVDCPKSKNARHLQKTRRIAAAVQEALVKQRLTDAVLRQEMQKLLYEGEIEGEGVC